jgi:TrwC relaxase
LIVAIFQHLTSREMDCQPHSHALVFRPSVSTDGQKKTTALDTGIFYSKVKKVVGAYYRANYAYLLTKKHGLSCVRKGESFDIRGLVLLAAAGPGLGCAVAIIFRVGFWGYAAKCQRRS